MYCKNCGTKLNESIAFCPTCGKANEPVLKFLELNQTSGNTYSGNLGNDKKQNGINPGSAYNDNRIQNGINTNSTYNNNRTQNGINGNSVYNDNRTQNGINGNSVYNDNRTQNGLDSNSVYNNKTQNNDYNYYADGSNYQDTVYNPNFSNYSNLSGTAYSANTNVANNVKPKSKKKSRIILILIPVYILISAVIACVLLAYFGIITLGPRGAVRNYFKALENGNSEKIYRTQLISDEVIDDMIDEGYNMSAKEYYKAMDKCYDTFYESLEDIGEVKLHYEIIEIENVEKLDKLKSDSKENSVTSLEDFQEEMEDFEEYGDFDADDIKKVYVAKIKWYLSVGDDKLEKKTSIAYIYKYRGKWQLIGGPELIQLLYEVYNSNEDGEYDDVYSNTQNALLEQLSNED
jgi:hypothetical protein